MGLLLLSVEADFDIGFLGLGFAILIFDRTHESASADIFLEAIGDILARKLALAQIDCSER